MEPFLDERRLRLLAASEAITAERGCVAAAIGLLAPMMMSNLSTPAL